MSTPLQIQSHRPPVLLSTPSLPAPIPRRNPRLRVPARQNRNPLIAPAALPALAAAAQGVASEKIDVEAIVVAVDDFFNRNPFFVAGVTFIWLVVIPLTQEYLKKYKAISAIDAFKKLRDVPGCQLLDIRGQKSLLYMDSPNLKFLGKCVVRVELVEGQEESFVREVREKFQDPANTVLCIVDSFDGNSLKVAESLYKNGFKEAYAIKDGLRGKDGWQAIQETLIPPSMHVSPRKRYKAPNGVNIAEKIDGSDNAESKAPSVVDEYDSEKESNSVL